MLGIASPRERSPDALAFGNSGGEVAVMNVGQGVGLGDKSQRGGVLGGGRKVLEVKELFERKPSGPDDLVFASGGGDASGFEASPETVLVREFFAAPLACDGGVVSQVENAVLVAETDVIRLGLFSRSFRMGDHFEKSPLIGQDLAHF